MKKKMIISAMVAGILSFGVHAYAMPTNVYHVFAPQEKMNIFDNPNYILVQSHMGKGWYLDVSSIINKSSNGEYAWSQNIVEVDIVNQIVTGEYKTQSYRYDDRNMKFKYLNTENGEWVDFDPFDIRERNQLNSRGFSLGFMSLFQGGNPVER